MSTADYSRIPRSFDERRDKDLAETLEKIWNTKPGFIGALGSVDHKTIGIRYIVTSLVFLLVGGLEALVMRVQLARPNQNVLSPEQYNQLFSMHGITMIFLYALPILSGFSNYLWPLMIGSRDVAYPRINALSYWIYVASGIFLYSGLFMGALPNAGWFNYVPYANRTYNPGVNIDIYALGMILFGISSTVGAINFVVTFLRMRCPGMSINRVPIIVWGTLSANAGNIFAVPAVSLACFLLWMDRNYGTHVFDNTADGQPMLWQHLFWMFAHPWVYVIVLPSMGMVSDALPVFCRRPIVGYTFVALGTVSTMIIGFGVWLHHMFATGLPNAALSFFGVASIVIAIPSGVAVFSWTATIWLGRPVFKTPLLFFASFIVLFVIGGVSGFMTGVVPVDWQLTDTYFVVAHLHYVLIGINVFPVIGSIYYWFPKMTGRMLSERLGQWNFWTMFVGVNLAFFPMHITGLLGMPRRIYTYPTGYGWDVLNMVTSVGSFLFGIGVLVLVVNVAVSLKRGAVAGDNPWDAPTLEWSVSSPPPSYNFKVIPVVESRNPLWEDRLRDTEVRSNLDGGLVLVNGKENTATSAFDAEPDVILKLPEDSYAPLLITLALSLFMGGLCAHTNWLAALGVVGMVASGFLWAWPRERLGQRAEPAAHV